MVYHFDYPLCSCILWMALCSDAGKRTQEICSKSLFTYLVYSTHFFLNYHNGIFRIFVVAYISSFFGPLRVFSFSVSAITLGLIASGVVGGNEDETPPIKEKDEAVENIVDADTVPPVGTEEIVGKRPDPPKDLNNGPEFDAAVSGDTHIQIIFALCVLIWLVRHDSMLFLVFMPLTIAGFRQISKSLLIPVSTVIP